MVRLRQISIILIILFCCNSAFAQFKSSTSTRSYGMGGFAESLCDDPLSMIDNLSAMGRDAKQRSHLLFSIGQVNYWDHHEEVFTSDLTSEDAQFNSIRFAYVPQFSEGSAKWMLWIDSIMPSIAWEGKISGFIEPNTEVLSKFMEIGFGVGFAVTDEAHVGIGIGMNFAFTKLMHYGIHRPSYPDYETISDLSYLPVGHLSFEYFILPELVVSLNSIIFISYFAEYENDVEVWEDMSATYLAGNGFLEFNLSASYELTPFLHLTGGASTISYKPGDYTYEYDTIDTWFINTGLGAEYIIKLGGTYAQLTLRAGFFLENLAGPEDELSFWYYKKMGVRFGVGIKLGALLINIAISQPINSEFENDVETAKISGGFRFK